MAENKSSIQANSGETYSERRRTQRVQIAMSVIVRGKIKNDPFEEQTRTVTVNANGCMVPLATPVVKGQQILLVNVITTEEMPCTVTFIGQKEGTKTQVGIEFESQSRLFWRITFPPEDWDSSQRKLPPNTKPPANPPRR